MFKYLFSCKVPVRFTCFTLSEKKGPCFCLIFLFLLENCCFQSTFTPKAGKITCCAKETTVWRWPVIGRCVACPSNAFLKGGSFCAAALSFDVCCLPENWIRWIFSGKWSTCRVRRLSRFCQGCRWPPISRLTTAQRVSRVKPNRQGAVQWIRFQFLLKFYLKKNEN